IAQLVPQCEKRFAEGAGKKQDASERSPTRGVLPVRSSETCCAGYPSPSCDAVCRALSAFRALWGVYAPNGLDSGEPSSRRLRRGRRSVSSGPLTSRALTHHGDDGDHEQDDQQDLDCAHQVPFTPRPAPLRAVTSTPAPAVLAPTATNASKMPMSLEM